MRAQSKKEILELASKIFADLDSEQKGTLTKAVLEEYLLRIHDKMTERFGFDPVSKQLQDQGLDKHVHGVVTLMRTQEDGLVRVEDLYRYMCGRNRMMAKGFTLLDVKLMRKSQDAEQIHAALTRIFTYLDIKKRGFIEIKEFKKFFNQLTIQMTCANMQIDWETLSEAFNADEEDPELAGEIETQAQEMIDLLDADKDGCVTLDDWYLYQLRSNGILGK